MQRGLLLSRHLPSDLVAFGAAGARSVEDLCKDVVRVANALPDGPTGGQVLLVIRSDRYAFAVAILAAWTRGYVPVLPPELDRDAITTLASMDGTVCVLHDTASGIPVQIASLLGASDADHAGSSCELAALLAGRQCESRSYARSADGALVAQRWGSDWLEQAAKLAPQVALAPGQRCASSVGSEHAHGAVLGVLVPLLSGAAFLRETLAPGALGSALASLRIDVLVTVPAHVPELLEGATADADRVPPWGEEAVAPTVVHRLARVVNALAALPPELAERGRRALGGAWSDLSPQAEEVPILHCLDDGHGSRPIAHTQREAEIEGMFRTRADVRDVAAVTLPDPPRVCVALTRDRRASEGHPPAPLPNEVPISGSECVELLEVNRIRRDGIGRTQRIELLRQFGLKPDGSPVNLTLRWGECARHEHAAGVEQRTRVEVPLDYGYFDGHFVGYPIMPGAAQLSELVLPCVRRAWPNLGRLTSMTRLKFTGRIQPGDTIDVLVSARASSASVDFALKRAEVLCSAGTLTFTLANGSRAQDEPRPAREAEP